MAPATPHAGTRSFFIVFVASVKNGIVLAHRKVAPVAPQGFAQGLAYVLPIALQMGPALRLPVWTTAALQSE